MKVIAILLLASLASCTYADHKRLIAFGGKGMAKGKHKGTDGGSYAVMWDNEDSFRVGAAAAAMVAGSIATAATNRAAEETSRAVAASNAKVQSEQIAADAAVKTAEINAGVETTKILNPIAK